MESVSMDAGRNLVEAKLQGLNGSLTGARSARIRIESDLKVVQSVPDRDPKQLLAIASVAADPQVAAAVARVKSLEEDVQSLSDQFRSKHPRMIEARNRLEEAKAEKVVAIQNAPGRLAAQFTEAHVSEQTLEKAVAEQEKELLKLDERTLPYRALQKELEADRALYDSVQKRLKETMVIMDIKPVNFRVVEPALPAQRLPNRRLIVVCGAILCGALLAAGVLAAIFFLDSSIKTVDDAERWLGLPVLSAIPTLRKVHSPAQTLSLLNQPDSPMAESFRSLRTALSLLGPVERRKVILFTSAVPSEGKTHNAVNAAIAFAQQGLQTLLLDADLRKPALTQLLLRKNRKLPGVAEYMVGAQVELHATEIANLSILPAGAHAPNPAELLSGERFAELIDTLKLQFDRIVIDTAPVNVVSDTLNIVGAAQTVVLVVRNGSTPRKVVRRALELLARAHVRPDGIALNFMPEWRGIASHYYYSSDAKYGGAETYGKNYQAAGHSKPTVKVPTAVASPKPLASSAG
ncbi:MAG TPA: polysaccharide biosynthesis tyrosine autokinase [Chthoniobacter sp.]|nr:polysaccharide biosynthesis tyrosine autokinase [Chthoniobacter sp.]